jgi:hypothetical protein
MNAARTLRASREAREPASAAQRRREALVLDDARQMRLLQIERLHSSWSLAIHDYLAALGKSTWGESQYEIVDEVDPYAYWRVYLVKGLEWHERTDRYRVRNQDDWCECEYRLGYRLRLELQDDHFTLGDAPLTQDSLKQWFLRVFEEGCPQCVEEHLVRIY